MDRPDTTTTARTTTATTTTTAMDRPEDLESAADVTAAGPWATTTTTTTTGTTTTIPTTTNATTTTTATIPTTTTTALPKSAADVTAAGPSARAWPALHDRVAQAVIGRYDELPGRGKPQGRSWTVLAGIVAEVQEEDSLQVLAVATGTRCIGVGAMMSGKGCVVHDCHAEVLCRRAFQRYLL
ncbi:unnamed protein product, partial [Polarella glacialis]